MREDSARSVDSSAAVLAGAAATGLGLALTDEELRASVAENGFIYKDGKGLFGYVGRGIHRRVAVNGPDLAHTNAELTDLAADICPVGCIIRKREGFSIPIGEREFDKGLIGHEIEEKRHA